MLERWRKGWKVLGVDEGDYVLRTRDGRFQRQTALILDPESVERIRTGYLCANCGEPYEEAWPERCRIPTCRFPIRTLQAEWFAREFAPEDPYAPKPIPLLEGLHERAAAAEAARRET